MDINYWILLLAIYLLSRWFRRRMRGKQPAPPPKTVEKATEREGLPKWFRELDLVDWGEEEAEELPVPEEEDVVPPEEVPEVSEPPPSELVFEPRREAGFAPEVERVRIARRRFGGLIYDVESLRELIVVREILGPPRAVQRYRSRVISSY